MVEENNSIVSLEQKDQSPTSILLQHVVQKEFANDQIQHLIVSLDIIDITSKSDFQILYKCLETLVKPGLVGYFDEERDYGSEDFINIEAFAVKAFLDLKHFLRKLKININFVKHWDILIPVILLCGTHYELFAWSSETAVKLSREICNEILIYCNMSSLKTVLCYTDESCQSSLFKRILLVLRPSLTKTTWVKNPSMCYIFQWLLILVTHPVLTDYLSDVLPPSLMFTDHHCVRYKNVGIGCLCHIIDNVPSAELKLYGRSDVVYDALYHLTYCKEIEVVQVLYPCILKLLIGLEGTLHFRYKPRKWNRYDDVYSQLVWHMEIEDKLILRREYSNIISDFIQVMGITILKHIKRSLRTFFEYLSISDAPEEISRINTLKALCILIRVAWPRMEDHCKEVIKSIMILAYDLETDHKMSLSEATIKNLLFHCKECLTQLKLACPKNFHDQVCDLKTLDNNFPGIKLLTEF